MSIVSPVKKRKHWTKKHESMQVQGYLVSAILLREEDQAHLGPLVSKAEHLNDKPTHASSTFVPEEPTSQQH